MSKEPRRQYRPHCIKQEKRKQTWRESSRDGLSNEMIRVEGMERRVQRVETEALRDVVFLVAHNKKASRSDRPSCKI